MNPVSHLIPGIRSFRPFLPAKEFKTSLRFYESIGFEAYRLGDTLAELSLGAHAFLLQGHYVKEWAENTVMHVLVNDVHAWWQHINSLDLANQFGVSSPARLAPSLGVSLSSMFSIQQGCSGTLQRSRSSRP